MEGAECYSLNVVFLSKLMLKLNSLYGGVNNDAFQEVINS